MQTLVEIAPRQWVRASEILALESDGAVLTVETRARLIVHEYADSRAATHRLHRLLEEINGAPVDQHRRRALTSRPVISRMSKK